LLKIITLPYRSDENILVEILHPVTYLNKALLVFQRNMILVNIMAGEVIYDFNLKEKFQDCSDEIISA